MQVYSVFDKEFKSYGKVLTGYDVSELVSALERFELPPEGTAYRPSVEELENCAIYKDFRDNAYGGAPIQVGMCWGRNTKLNCLEYHRCSEIIVTTEDVTLLMAKLDEVEDYTLDTKKIKAFALPKHTVLEIYATTLHYAACNPYTGYRIAVVLADGSNRNRPQRENLNEEDKLLWGSNNWLLAHEESNEGKMGAHIGLIGENIEVKA